MLVLNLIHLLEINRILPKFKHLQTKINFILVSYLTVWQVILKKYKLS